MLEAAEQHLDSCRDSKRAVLDLWLMVWWTGRSGWDGGLNLLTMCVLTFYSVSGRRYASLNPVMSHFRETFRKCGFLSSLLNFLICLQSADTLQPHRVLRSAHLKGGKATCCRSNSVPIHLIPLNPVKEPSSLWCWLNHLKVYIRKAFTSHDPDQQVGFKACWTHLLGDDWLTGQMGTKTLSCTRTAFTYRLVFNHGAAASGFVGYEEEHIDRCGGTQLVWSPSGEDHVMWLKRPEQQLNWT